MTYLLIIPIGLYIALATLILHRQPRSLSYVVVALYTLAAALATSGYLVLGTTADPSIARIAGVLVVLNGSLIYTTFMPLALVGLYFESWLAIHRRQVLARTVSGQGAILVALVLLIYLRRMPVVVQVNGDCWQHWPLLEAYLHPWRALVILLLSQLPAILVIGTALYYHRLSLWRGAVALTLVNVISVLLPLIAPLAGSRWLMLVTASGFVPVVLLYTLLMLHVARQAPLMALTGSAFQRYNEGLIVLDALDRVVWHNAEAERWLPWPPSNIAPQPIRELLHGTLLLAPVRHLLSSDDADTECAWCEDDREIVLRLELHPLDNVRFVPGAQLLTLRDITDTRVLLNMHVQRTELLALSAISADIASSLDLDQVIARALQQVRNMIQADGAVVYLLDDEHPDQLVLTGKTVRDSQGRATREIPQHLPIAGTMAGRVIKHGTAVFTSNTAHADEPGARLFEYGMQAGATVPLRARDRVTGVLQMGMYEPRDFDPVTIALLESVGQQLGVAIDNARLHHQERHQRRVAEALSSIAGVLTTSSLDDALQTLLDQLKNLVAYDRASVLLRQAPGQLWLAAYAGFENVPGDDALRDVRIMINEYPYLQALFDGREPQIVADTTADPQWTHGAYRFGSWIGVPLVFHEQVLGCLTISHREPGFFNHDDLKLSATFADQAVIAVENARLFEAEQQRRRFAEFLQHASYDLVTSPDLDSALTAALTHLANVLDFDRAHIGLLDDTRTMWITRVTYPPDTTPNYGQVLPLNYFPLVARMVNERQPVHVPDTREETAWIPDPPSAREIRSWIGVPLISRENLIGLLNFYSYEPHKFSQEQLDLTRVFANQTAAALENFRLLDEASRRNRTLSALNSVLSASNEALAARQNVLGVSLARVLDALNMPGGAIHQIDSDRRCLRLQSAAGLPAPVIKALRRVPVEHALESMTLPAQTGPDGTEYTFISIPLSAHGRANGLLSIVWAAGERVDVALRELLISIGQQLGVVLDNVLLFETTTQRAALSTDLNRLSLAISAQLDRDTVLNLLCDESIGVFDVQGAYIWLVEGAQMTGAAASGPGAAAFRGHTLDLSHEDLLPVQVLERWRPQIAHDITPDSPALPADFIALTRAESALAIPLLKADVPLGVLLLVNTERPNAFAYWSLEQIAVLGVQAALALQNAHLFQEVRRRLDHLKLVHETSRYATAILSLAPLIQGVTQKIVRSLDYDMVSLLEATPEALLVHTIYFGELMLHTSAGTPQLSDRLFAQANDAVHQAAPLQLNVDYDDLLTPDMLARLPAGNADTYCVLAVPMVIADEVTGVLVVARARADSINGEDLDVLQPLAAQLAISIANARLYEKVRQQTAALEARVHSRTAEIRRQHERTEAILRSVADAVIVLDMQAHMIMSNPVARSLFDQHDLDMDLGARVRALVAPILKTTHDGYGMSEIFESGPVALQAKAAPVVNAGQTVGAVVVLRDISPLRELDHMKDQFVSNVSHELRTPLANLKLYLSLLEQGSPERRDRYMDVMTREVERLERLIGDLLQISRLRNKQRQGQPPTRETIDLEALINSVIEGHLALAQSEGIALRHECATPPLPAGYGDPDQIFRAISNLVSNALHYTPTGGSVTVESRVECTEQTKPEWVIIDVVDTGIGIPAQDMPVIFERFYRGSNVSPTIAGTGLGLAIVKEIIELHAGRIEVESQEGHGSTFRIALPVINGHRSNESLVEIVS